MTDLAQVNVEPFYQSGSKQMSTGHYHFNVYWHMGMLLYNLERNEEHFARVQTWLGY
jgi:hypothetical protein